jgi:hypothetical protein
VGIAVLAAGCDDKPGIGTAARIRVVPTFHSFAAVPVGQQDRLRVTVTNIGGGRLTVSRVALTPGSSRDFSLSAMPEMPRALGTNQSFAFEVVYSPSDASTDSGRVEVVSDDRQSPTVNVELRTQEIGPDIDVQPPLLDFGTVPRFQTQTLTATLRNEGFADLIVENIVTSPGGDFAIVQPTSLPLTLAPSAEAELTVAYTPTGCARDEDRVQIFSNDLDETPFEVTVRGRPPGPAVDADPATVSFGAVNLGTPASQIVTVKNVGTTDLTISSIFLGIGSDPAFTIQAPQTPVVLGVGQTRPVTVSYRPGQVGVARGALVISSDDCDHPQLQVPLEGIGTEGPAALIQVTPSSLNFGNVATGSAADRSFTVVSIGSLPLTVTGIAPEAGTTPEFSVVGGGGAFNLGACTTPPCPSQNVTVRYAPTGQGSDSGNIVVSSNAANDPNARVAVLGNGTAGATCAIDLSPGTILNFRSVALGSSLDLPVTLTNNGTGNCTYEKTDIDFITAGMGFRVQSQPGIGAIIAPGQQKQVVIRFQPPSLGPKQGLAIIHWNDPNPGGTSQSATLLLTGFSVEANIEVIPGRLDFGLITVGCASQVLTLTVFNTGSADLRIRSIRLQNSPSRFRIVQAPPPDTLIPGGMSVEVKLRYIPTAVGMDTDTLIIESDDPDEPTTSVPLQGQGTTVVDVIDKFVQATEPKVDILFVVDNSGSMGEEQSNLRTNFRDFAQIAQTWTVNYQIGVITTDSPRLQGNPLIIRPTDPDPVAEFGSNANVGTSGSGTEQGLEMAYRALSDPLITGHNAGILRADASLEVIVVSDEEDQSPQSLDFYISFFYSIKGAQNTSLFHFSAIAGDVPNGCNSGAGSAEAGRRYEEVARRTGGVFGSICDASFAQTLRAIGNRAFGLRVQFFLSRQPDMTQPFSVRRYANEAACDADPNATGGTVVPNNPNTGWTFDPPSNSILFGPQAIPQRGECIKVKYKAACLPP